MNSEPFFPWPQFLVDGMEAASLLLSGGLLIYPTETYYALGCLANNTAAIRNVYRIKNRVASKPLPLIAGDIEQAAHYVDLGQAPANLLRTFWPGPLTVLLPALPNLPPVLCNPQNRAALRISSAPCVRQLARLCGFPLTASSANISGRKPASSLALLDPDLIHALSGIQANFGILPGNCAPATAQPLPSTIVEPVKSSHGNWQLKIHRAGAISGPLLEKENFEIIDAGD